MYASSMDSARGLHFPMVSPTQQIWLSELQLDTIYMVGIPRNANEYVHISGIC